MDTQEYEQIAPPDREPAESGLREALLEPLANDLDAGPADENGILTFELEGETLHLVAPETDPSRILVRAELGSVSDIDNPVEFFEDLLAAGLFGLETAGAVPSIAGDTAFLTAYLDAEDFSDAGELEERLDDLAFAVRDWRTRLEVHQGAVGTDETAEVDWTDDIPAVSTGDAFDFEEVDEAVVSEDGTADRDRSDEDVASLPDDAPSADFAPQLDRFRMAFAEFAAMIPEPVGFDEEGECELTVGGEATLVIRMLPEAGKVLCWAVVTWLADDESALERARMILMSLEMKERTGGISAGLDRSTRRLLAFDIRSARDFVTADDIAAWIDNFSRMVARGRAVLGLYHPSFDDDDLDAEEEF